MIRRLLNKLFYCNLLIAWAFSYQASAQTLTNCHAAPAENAGHAVWLNKYKADGKAASFVYDNQGGVLEENAASGTAHLGGLIYNTKDPNDKWIVNLNLSNKMNWDQWSALGRGYKDEQGLAGDRYKEWSYYILDTSVASSLTGAGKNEGQVISLAHNPVNYYYGFQVGEAANSKNAKYGLSGWFLYSLEGAEPINGDFNLDLSCGNDPLPEECNDCFSTNVLEVAEADNCVNYSIEVLQDGTCDHALSHFTVAVPCGTVSNITNSAGWAIETGQDPTTDLYGFKIDDIKNFGESNNPQSFTVNFTICTDDAACKETLGDWSAVVAYKAAQCVNYDTLIIEKPPVLGDGEDPIDFPYTDVCVASPFGGNGHAVWLNKYNTDQTQARFVFGSEPGKLKENKANGTAHLDGTIVNQNDPEDGWIIDLWLSDRMGWTEWSALGRDYKDESNLAGDAYKEWSYYIMDLGKTSTLTGIGKNIGKVMTLAHNPTNYHYGFQVGTAANSKNASYGLSGWMLYSLDGAAPINGDFNLDLSQCEVVNPDPDPDPDPIPSDTTICDVNDFAAYLAIKDISCPGNSDGHMSIQITGGQGPFTYSWSNGATTQDLDNLSAGAYLATVTDGEGLALELAGVITEADPLSISGSITTVTCAGNNNGAIYLTVNGGASPYNYSWSNGATSADITDLSGGDYSVTVTDANGCSQMMAFTVLASNAMTANISSNECNDGSLSLAVSGGNTPYSYAWSTGAVTRDVKVTEAGTYSVTITDANGCTANTEITVDQPQAFDLTIADTKPSCSGGDDGSIDLTVTGGQAPYSYLWSNGSTDEDLTNIASGSYTVIVGDGRGCSQTLTYFLSNPTSIFISGTATPIQCGGNNADGEIDLKIFNGVAPYAFSWSNGATTEDISGLVAGFYTVTVSDATGCSNIRTFEIEEPSPMQVDISGLYCGDGYICPTIAGGSGSYTYEWSTGDFTSCIQVTEAGTYTVTVRDENNCEASKTIVIGEPSAKLAVDLNWTDLSCNGANDGTAALTITGGKEPYEILWSHGEITPSVSGLSAGVYQVSVSDLNGCSQSKIFNVVAPEMITVTAQTITEASCTDQSDGAIDISVTSGIGPFTYAWSNGAVSEDLSGLMAGFYDVTVTDGNGCSHSVQFEVAAVNTTNCDGGDPNDGGDPGDGGGDPGNGDPGDGGNDGPCIRDCNECDGKVTELTLKYLGDQVGAHITVTQKNDGVVAFDGTVAPDGTFSVVGQDKKETLSTEIIITINGVQNTTMHTSCSVPIGPGMIKGDFEVVDGESRNGGLLCAVESDSQPQDEEPPVVDPETGECPDAFSTTWSISNVENGCTTYTMEVMYNGQGRHGLSHFSVDIPCGEVTEASNSEGWPMEMNGKDPTTGLSGFKVDDINGFGEGSAEQSFEVSFTLCADGVTCKDNLADWAPMVAYKAGQCVNYDTLSHTAKSESSNTRTFVDYDLYPNPSKQGSEVRLRFNEINDQEEVVVAIRNLTGVSFYNEQHKIDGSKEVLLQLNRLPEGVYFVTVKAHDKLYTSKLIVQ